MNVLVGGKWMTVEITRKRMKNVVLRIKDDHTLRVSCPYGTSEAFIEGFIQSHEKWILKTQLHQQRNEIINREGVNGPIIYWLGEKKYVQYEEGKRNNVIVDGDILTFYLKETTDEMIAKTFRKKAASVIEGMINERRYEWDEAICFLHQIAIPNISVRYMKSRWGVCYPQKKQITISSRLIHYPSVCLDAILLHEYAHLLVPNHSKDFYNLIESYMPNYREYEKLLK